jgi:FMN-dependent oxidoreductase (nitrilotriacetate monooxygenase family)
MFHLGWFLKNGYGVQGWGQPWTGRIGRDWMKPDIYIDLARAAERACFDYIMIEDTLLVNDIFGASMEFPLRTAQATPKHDPMPLLAIIAQATSRIGLIGTVSTSFYPPFMAARLATTLDHLSDGRIGLNLVTSSSHRAAQNFGLPQHHEHDLRYAMADEWMEVVGRLWESWDDDAVLADEASGIYADHTKVARIDFEGKHYASRGPLNTMPGPQRRPVICQAGGSPAGRDFAARHADTIIGSARGVEAMSAFREDMHRRLRGHGRDPAHCKILFLVSPILGDTDAEARDKRDRQKAAEARDITPKLAVLSYFSGIDMAQFDPDEPIADLIENNNGHRSTLMEFAKAGRTLREMATHAATESVELVGSCDSVAGEMAEIMQQVGGDGFLIANTVTRKAIAEITDGLATALRRRKLIRSDYAHTRFRDTLLEF